MTFGYSTQSGTFKVLLHDSLLSNPVTKKSQQWYTADPDGQTGGWLLKWLEASRSNAELERRSVLASASVYLHADTIKCQNHSYTLIRP